MSDKESDSLHPMLKTVLVLGILLVGGQWLYHRFQAWRYNSAGIALLSNGKHGDAIKCFSKAIAADEDNADAHRNRARAYVRIGEPEKAAADSRAADAIAAEAERKAREEEDAKRQAADFQENGKNRMKRGLRRVVENWH